MNPSRPKLTDILAAAGGNGNFRDRWANTTAAADFTPLPPGDYICHAITGELFTARTNHTPGYKVTFKVIEGEYAGRLFWHDLWLTAPALPMSKRDLALLGITEPEQMEKPLPPGIRCRVRAVLRTGDDGRDYNEVRRFTVLGIDPPPANPFAPVTVPETGPDGLPVKPNDGIPI